jgi:hypothetical protein
MDLSLKLSISGPVRAVRAVRVKANLILGFAVMHPASLTLGIKKLKPSGTVTLGSSLPETMQMNFLSESRTVSTFVRSKPKA